MQNGTSDDAGSSAHSASASSTPVTPGTPGPPRWLRYGLVVLATVLAGALFAVTTAQARLGFGPHEATYTMSADGLVVADFGPLGTLQMDSPLPLHLGVHVQVGEIPTGVGEAQTLDELGNDLNAYIQFFGDPGAVVSDVTSALVANALLRFVVFLGTVGLVGSVGYVLLGAARRRELSFVLAPRTGQIAVGLVVLLVVTTTTSSQREAPVHVAAPTAVFDGTPLAGTRVTGRLSGIVDTYGGMIVTAIRDNEAYYARATDAVTVAWNERMATTAAQDALLPPGLRSGALLQDRLGGTDASVETAPAPLEDGALGDGTQDGSQPQDAATDESAEAIETAEPASDEPDEATGTAEVTGPAEPAETAVVPDEISLSEDAQIVTMLVISDLHCNVGMTPVIRRVAELADVDAVLNAGDTTMNGTSVEKVCVSSFATATPDGVPTIVSGGNHDSALTADQMTAAGMTMLEGEVIDVAGVRILGERDPAETRVGSGTRILDETADQMGARLAEVACTDPDGVDLLLVHTPRVGTPVLESGCVPVQVSGHMHRRLGPLVVGQGVRYVNGSTAGAASGELTVGPLRGTAELTVLRFDVNSRTMLDYRLVTITPDGTAQVGAAVRFTSPPQTTARVSPLDQQPQ